MREQQAPIEWHGFTRLGAAEIEKPDFIIDEWIISGMMVVGGPPKSLKSSIVLALTAAVAGYQQSVLPPLKVKRSGLVYWLP